MSMAGYTKLFSSILASTIWREDDKTRIVWITLLAMADKNGVAEGSVPGLADFARVSVADCRVSLAKLASPDPDSRTPEFEGRRIETVDGGWKILNHAKYRAKLNADERREYLRKKQAEHRAKLAAVNTASTLVNSGSETSTPSTQAEAEAEAEAEAKVKKQSPLSLLPESLNTPEFRAAWDSWAQHRREIRKPLAPTSCKAQFKKLEAMGLNRAIAALEHSTAEGYQGVFEPRETKGTNHAHLGSNPRNDNTY